MSTTAEIAARLAKLILCLSTNVNRPLEEIARLIDCSIRTLYRYLIYLEDAGFRLVHLYGKVYKLEGLQAFLPALQQFPAQSDASSIAGIADSKIYRPGYPVRSIPYLENCINNAKLLLKATREHRKVRLINYESSSRNCVCDRIVEPYDYNWYYVYTWAYDLKEHRNLLFRTSRIGQVEILDQEWTETHRHRRYSLDIFGCSSVKTQQVKLRLTMRAHNLLIEEHPQAIPFCNPDGNDWILDVPVCGFQGVGSFILSIPHQITILQGDGLRKYLHARLDETRHHIDRMFVQHTTPALL